MQKVNDEITKFYNQNYLTELSRGGYYPEKLEFYLEKLQKLKSKKLKILDIACNDGGLTKNFTKYGDVIGIDINKDAIRKCRKRGIKCFQTDISEFSKSHRSEFDVVVAGDIIEHVFDTDKFLISIRKVLKKEGTLLLTTANVASLGRRIMLLFGKNPFLEYSIMFPNTEINVGHIRYYTVNDMHLQLAQLGFREIEIFGDKINLTSNIFLPRPVAKHFPKLSRYMHICAKKAA